MSEASREIGLGMMLCDRTVRCFLGQRSGVQPRSMLGRCSHSCLFRVTFTPPTYQLNGRGIIGMWCSQCPCVHLHGPDLRVCRVPVLVTCRDESQVSSRGKEVRNHFFKRFIGFGYSFGAELSSCLRRTAFDSPQCLQQFMCSVRITFLPNAGIF